MIRASPHFSPDFGCNLRMGRRYERVLASADLRRTVSTTRPAPVRATLVSPTPPRFRSNSGEKCGLNAPFLGWREHAGRAPQIPKHEPEDVDKCGSA